MTTKAPVPKKAPAEWADDQHVYGRRLDKSEHEARRDCQCNPRRVGLPVVTEGGETVKTTHVLHR